MSKQEFERKEQSNKRMVEWMVEKYDLKISMDGSKRSTSLEYRNELSRRRRES